MIKIYLLFLSIFFLGASSFAQNSFPTNGNVGIGTSSPSNLLTLNSGNGADIMLQQNGANIAAFSVNSNSSTWNGGYGIGLNLTATSADINLLTGTPAVPTFTVKNSGNVGIGTTAPDAKLAVNGTVHAKEVRVDLNVPGPDYVFVKSYSLRSLATVNKYILLNHHLPDVPSAKSMEQNGIDISAMNMKLLTKVEELTLYLLEQNKALKIQKLQNLKQQEEINHIKQQMQVLSEITTYKP